MKQDPPRAGIFQALKSIPLTLLAMGQTRLELLANELEAQKISALRMMVLAQAMMFCTLVGVVCVVALLTLLLWDQRIAVLAIAAAVFLLAALWCYRALMRVVHAPEAAFAATLAELREDMRQLRAASSHAGPSD